MAITTALDLILLICLVGLVITCVGTSRWMRKVEQEVASDLKKEDESNPHSDIEAPELQYVRETYDPPKWSNYD